MFVFSFAKKLQPGHQLALQLALLILSKVAQCFSGLVKEWKIEKPSIKPLPLPPQKSLKQCLLHFWEHFVVSRNVLFMEIRWISVEGGNCVQMTLIKIVPNDTLILHSRCLWPVDVRVQLHWTLCTVSKCFINWNTLNQRGRPDLCTVVHKEQFEISCQTYTD